MNDTIQWYDVLKACYGCSLDDVEIMVWYSNILEKTNAKNDEICSTLQWAKGCGKKSSLAGNKVSMMDLIKWVRDMRKQQKVTRKGGLPYNEREYFICKWRSWLELDETIETLKEAIRELPCDNDEKRAIYEECTRPKEYNL